MFLFQKLCQVEYATGNIGRLIFLCKNIIPVFTELNNLYGKSFAAGSMGGGTLKKATSPRVSN